MKITVKELRQIIKEELISIKRGNRTIFYNAEIDDDDNISSVSKTDVSDEFKKVLAIAEKYTRASSAEIIEAVSAYKGKLFKSAASIEDIRSDMAENWLGTLKWETPSTKGKGEAAVHISFAADESVREPDFVSADNKVRISIKYTGNGGTPVRSADTASSDLSTALENFKGLLGKDFNFPPNNFTPEKFREVLKTILQNKDESEVEGVIQNLSTAMEAIKAALITEHGAQAMLVFTNNSVSIIKLSNISNIRLRYIKNGNRVEYFCIPLDSQNSYDNILKNYNNPEPVNYRQLVAKRKKAALAKSSSD